MKVKTSLASRANAYVKGLRTAERIGFERGYSGHALEPCPYKRWDMVKSFKDGWLLGSRKRSESNR